MLDGWRPLSPFRGNVPGPDDNAFVVDVPELPGCMAHGDTPAEAVSHAQDAISLWLDVAKNMARAVPVPRGRLLSA